MKKLFLLTTFITSCFAVDEPLSSVMSVFHGLSHAMRETAQTLPTLIREDKDIQFEPSYGPLGGVFMGEDFNDDKTQNHVNAIFIDIVCRPELDTGALQELYAK